MGSNRRWAFVAAAVVVAVAAALVWLGAADDGDSVVADGATSTSTSVATTSTSTLTAAAPAQASTTPTTSQAAPRPTSPTAMTATTAARGCLRPAAGSDFAGFGATEIVIQNAAGAHRSCVLTADTDDQQRQGLMRQDDLDGYDGMIFRFPTAEERGFWMRNTRIPLSIAFFDASGSFVSASDMEPCGDSPDCPGYRSNGAAKFALEVLKGRLPAVGADPGSRLIG